MSKKKVYGTNPNRKSAGIHGGENTSLEVLDPMAEPSGGALTPAQYWAVERKPFRKTRGGWFSEAQAGINDDRDGASKMANY